jgi:hypothetical protein
VVEDVLLTGRGQGVRDAGDAVHVRGPGRALGDEPPRHRAEVVVSLLIVTPALVASTAVATVQDSGEAVGRF